MEQKINSLSLKSVNENIFISSMTKIVVSLYYTQYGSVQHVGVGWSGVGIKILKLIDLEFKSKFYYFVAL